MTGGPPPRSGLTVRRYEDGDQDAIRRFNARLAAGGAPHLLYEEPPGVDDTSLPRERLFVVADGAEIRGGAFLREMAFKVGDDTITVGFVKYPVAESLVDKAFAGVPVALLVHLMRVQPVLAALGMGGHAGPFAQLLARLRWQGSIVTTLVAPLKPHAMAAQLPQIRGNAKLRRLAAIARYSGAAAVAGLVLRGALRLRQRWVLRNITVRMFDQFDARDDALWEGSRARYRSLLVRDSASLRWRYPAHGPPLLRLRIERGAEHIGWVVLQVVESPTPSGDGPFGALTLGIVCDALALPEHADVVVSAAMAQLMERRVDLALTNHSHSRWQQALKRTGFLRGPENFAFYRSPQLERELTSRGLSVEDIMIARGDDGLFAL